MKLTLHDDIGSFHNLARSFGEGIRSIACERAEEFDTRTADVELIVAPQNEWVLYTIFGAVRISAGAVQTVWALCAAYWTMYKSLEGKSAATGEVIVKATPELDAAIDLFRFALSRLNGNTATYPKYLPTPASSAPYVAAANQLATGCIATYVLHELHHLSVATAMDEIAAGFERERRQSLQEEKDADAFAASWLLKTTATDRPKRALCVAVASVILAGASLAMNSEAYGSHPPGNQRLVSILVPYLTDDDDEWAVVHAMLALHAKVSGVVLPSGPFATFGQAVLGMAAALDAKG